LQQEEDSKEQNEKEKYKRDCSSLKW